MATYNVAVAKHATLVATVVDTVNFSASVGYVRVHNRSNLGPLYFRLDGTNPSVGGDDSFVVDGNGEKVMVVPDPANVSVRLVASIAASYSVEFAGS